MAAISKIPDGNSCIPLVPGDHVYGLVTAGGRDRTVIPVAGVGRQDCASAVAFHSHVGRQIAQQPGHIHLVSDKVKAPVVGSLSPR
jgi:hypothetical protein